jgi:PAS domain S-box-containing protein
MIFRFIHHIAYALAATVFLYVLFGLAMLWGGVESFSALFEGIAALWSGIGETKRFAVASLFFTTGSILFVLIRRSDSIFDGVFTTQNVIINQQHEKLGVVSKELNEQKKAFDRNILSFSDTKKELNENKKSINCIRKIQSQAALGSSREQLYKFMLGEILRLTDSAYGFIGTIELASETSSFVVSHDANENKKKIKTGKYKKPTGTHPYTLDEISGNPIIENYPATKERVMGFPDQHPSIINHMALALRSGEKTIGVLGIANRSGGFDTALVDNILPVITFCADLIATHEMFDAGNQAQMISKEADAQRRSILNAMHDGVITFDDQGIVRYLNPSAETMFFIGSEEAEGMSISEFFDLPDWQDGKKGGVGQYIKGLSFDKDDARISLAAKRRDGKEILGRIVFEPFENDGEKYYYAIFHDLSAFKEAEEALRVSREETEWLELQRRDIQKEIAESRQAEQLALANIEKIERSSRTKFELVASMSNELCTPLTAIVGFSDSILKGALGDDDNSQLREYIEHIDATGRKLQAYIEEALDVTGVEVGKMGIDPNDAIAISDYAKYSAYVRHDQHMVEALFQRALEMDPGNPIILSNYSVFRTSIRNDHEREDTLYKYAIEADPDSALAHGQYAVFLSEVRKHHDRAEGYYKSAIKLDSGNSENLVNYATFLTDVYNYHDRAENFFKRAIESDPENAIVLGQYAHFLSDVRNNPNQAGELFERAIEAAPEALSLQLDYAMVMFSTEEVKRGIQMLEKVIPGLSGEQLLKALFYKYIYSRAAADKDEALIGIRKLLEQRVRSPLFDPSQDLRRLSDKGHADIKLLEALTRVITVRDELKKMDDFAKWKTLDGSEDKKPKKKKSKKEKIRLGPPN